MSKLDKILIAMAENDDLLGYFGETGNTEAKRLIKDLMLELMKEAYGTSLFGETTARDIYTNNLRKKIEEL